jgi:DNA-binding Lrp family transcriptional regulator
MLDKIDKILLEELQTDSKRKVDQLSKRLNIPRTTVHNRIKKLEKEKYIKCYRAIVDAAKIGKPLTVLIGVVIGAEVSSRDIASQIKKYSQVEDVYIVAGQYDIIAKVKLKDTSELASLIFGVESSLRATKGITQTESMIVLETAKEYGIIPTH